MPESAYTPADAAMAKDNFVVLSGCSGGGKSALLSEIESRGFRVFAEPGRQVIKEQHYIGGDAAPGHDIMKFVELTISRTMHHMIESSSTRAPVFFDRSIVDQVSGLEHLKIDVPAHMKKAVEAFRYNESVFMVPPWPEIFRNDCERTHSFDDACAQYATLRATYERLGYRLVVVPKAPVPERADFLLGALMPPR
jgi:predicted ATPase